MAKIKAMRVGKTLIVAGSVDDPTFMKSIGELRDDLKGERRHEECEDIQRAAQDDPPPEIPPGG
jgi:hypothetical protein